MEYFKDIPGYEGTYQVSNMGRVVNTRREIAAEYGISQSIISRIKYGEAWGHIGD